MGKNRKTKIPQQGYKPQQKAPIKRIHGYIATPAYNGMVEGNYALSIAETTQVCTLAGINVTVSIVANGAFIDLARNTFVRMFLETNCTHLFFIDSDLRWEARAVLALLTAGFPVCAGAYPKRQDIEEYPLHLTRSPENKMIVQDGWILCDRAATGFLCIERSVIEKMVAVAPVIHMSTEPDQPRLFYTYLNEESSFVGEDYAWCVDYKKQFETPIPVWPDFDFTHGVRWKGNWHNFMNKQAEEAVETGFLDASGQERAAKARADQAEAKK